jgi:hypothetical protein
MTHHQFKKIAKNQNENKNSQSNKKNIKKKKTIPKIPLAGKRRGSV